MIEEQRLPLSQVYGHKSWTHSQKVKCRINFLILLKIIFKKGKINNIL